MRSLNVHSLAELIDATRRLGFVNTPSEPYPTTVG